MAKMKNLEDFLMDELKDLYSAEKQLTKALPKMAKAATSPELQQAFTDHLEETEGHIERLDKIAKLAGGKSLGGKKCKAMEGLVEEGKELMEEDATSTKKVTVRIPEITKVYTTSIAKKSVLKVILFPEIKGMSRGIRKMNEETVIQTNQQPLQ